MFSAVIAAHLLVTQFGVLLGLRVLLGVAEAAFFVAGVAALADLAPAERLGEALSYNSLGLYLGIAVGPALGDWLLGIGGYPAAWVSAAALGLLATFLATGQVRRLFTGPFDSSSRPAPADGPRGRRRRGRGGHR